jgi:hypothetical protein
VEPHFRGRLAQVSRATLSVSMGARRLNRALTAATVAPHPLQRKRPCLGSCVAESCSAAFNHRGAASRAHGMHIFKTRERSAHVTRGLCLPSIRRTQAGMQGRARSHGALSCKFARDGLCIVACQPSESSSRGTPLGWWQPRCCGATYLHGSVGRRRACGHAAPGPDMCCPGAGRCTI